MVEHLLAEPKIDDVSVDGVLNFGKDNTLKDLGMSEFSCGFDYLFNSYSKGKSYNVHRFLLSELYQFCLFFFREIRRVIS